MGALERRGAQSGVTLMALVMEFGFCLCFCAGGADVEGEFVWLLWFVSLCHADVPVGAASRHLPEEVNNVRLVVFVCKCNKCPQTRGPHCAESTWLRSSVSVVVPCA